MTFTLGSMEEGCLHPFTQHETLWDELADKRNIEHIDSGAMIENYCAFIAQTLKNTDASSVSRYCI